MLMQKLDHLISISMSSKDRECQPLVGLKASNDKRVDAVLLQKILQASAREACVARVLIEDVSSAMSTS